MSAVLMEVPRATKASAATEASNNGAITQARYDRVVEALRAYKGSTRCTWAELATSIGGEYSDSTLSVLASGKYPLESSHKLIVRIEEFLRLVEERRALVTQPTFVATSVSKRIFALIKRVVLFSKIGVIGAESGTGKTRSLEEWHIGHPNATYIRANRTFSPSASSSRASSSPAPTMAKIAKAIGCVDALSMRSQAFVYDAIVGTLRGTGRLLILDEAHFLPSEALDVIRTIHEDANIPVVLAGHAALYDRGPRDYESLIAFRSRALREKFLTSQIRSTDVDLIASQIVGVDVARDASKVLLQESQSSGGFRRLVTLLQVAQTYRNSDEAVTKAHVLRAIDERPEDGGVM